MIKYVLSVIAIASCTIAMGQVDRGPEVIPCCQAGTYISSGLNNEGGLDVLCPEGAGCCVRCARPGMQKSMEVIGRDGNVVAKYEYSDMEVREDEQGTTGTYTNARRVE